MDTVRELFLEYQNAIHTDLCFQGFQEELRSLPGLYAQPRGCILLALCGEKVAGCIALKPLEEEGACEMKRLFVRDEFKGAGIGRALAVSLIEEARRIGYRVMRLDTLSHMHAAHSLYRSLGFTETQAYSQNPLEGVVFMELMLGER